MNNSQESTRDAMRRSRAKRKEMMNENEIEQMKRDLSARKLESLKEKRAKMTEEEVTEMNEAKSAYELKRLKEKRAKMTEEEVTEMNEAKSAYELKRLKEKRAKMTEEEVSNTNKAKSAYELRRLKEKRANMTEQEVSEMKWEKSANELRRLKKKRSQMTEHELAEERKKRQKYNQMRRERGSKQTNTNIQKGLLKMKLSGSCHTNLSKMRHESALSVMVLTETKMDAITLGTWNRFVDIVRGWGFDQKFKAPFRILPIQKVPNLSILEICVVVREQLMEFLITISHLV
jgi:hypothetical protein